MNQIKTPSRYLADVGGNLAIPFALSLIVIMGAAGAGLDLGRVRRVETKLQTALDAAVLAGAAKGASSAIAAASEVFDANISRPDAKSVSASFTQDGGGALTGTANATVETTFARVLGFKEFAVKVSSAAKGGVASGGRACIIVLDPTASQSLLVNSGANIDAPTCEIHVASKANPAAIFNAGSQIDTARICIAGANIIDNGGIHPNLYKSCAATANPYAGTLPTPLTSGCDVNASNYSGNVSLSPGVYCGTFNFNAGPNVTFAPGVYVIKGGDWNVNGGTWSGNGVTFYFPDSSRIQFNSAVAATMSSPTSGSYAGIFMYEADGLARSPFVLDDSRNMDVTGLIYLPSRDMIFNSGSNLTDKHITLVTNTLILDQTHWTLQPSGPDVSTSQAGVPVLIK